MRSTRGEERTRTTWKIAVLAGAAALGVLGSSGVGYAHRDRISGEIRIPTFSPWPCGPGDPVLARCAWLTRGGSSQGILGHMVQLDEEHADGLHRFTLQTSTPQAYLFVAFYTDLGSCEGRTSLVGDAGPASRGSAVSGFIPVHARHALVVLVTTVSPFCDCLGLVGPPVVQISQAPADFTLRITEWSPSDPQPSRGKAT